MGVGSKITIKTSHLCTRLEDFSKVAISDGSEITMRTSHLCISLENFFKVAIGDCSAISMRTKNFSKVPIGDALPKR